jgi:anaerobic ribonucleoside-triphosphate reductase activating protein
MGSHTWVLDPATGALVAEGLGAEEALALAGDLLPAPRPLGCARPVASQPLPAPSGAPGPLLRVARLYHGSVVDGPGRRSVIQLQGCPIRCPGCHVPETHDPAGGVELPVADVVAGALAPSGAPRDGVTITGGEPFFQPGGLLALVRGLRAEGCPHVLCYSGYTLAALRARSERQPPIAEVLATIDLLIDGPFVASAAAGAGLWVGSRNQHVVDLAACRRRRAAPVGRSHRHHNLDVVV